MNRIKNRIFSIQWWFMIVLCVGAAPALAQSFIHYKLSEDPSQPAPAKVVLLPLDVEIFRISAGGVVESHLEWREKAISAIKAGLAEYDESKSDIEFVSLPTVTTEQQAIIDEHLALYHKVSNVAHNMITLGGDAWQHKRDRFDYTIGPGLAFLSETTGVHHGLVIIAGASFLSGGSKAVNVATALLGGVVSRGRTFLTAGLVDFKSGDIQWFNFQDQFRYRDVRLENEADDAVEQLFESFLKAIE